jgi:hypothetical protein
MDDGTAGMRQQKSPAIAGLSNVFCCWVEGYIIWTDLGVFRFGILGFSNKELVVFKNIGFVTGFSMDFWTIGFYNGSGPVFNAIGYLLFSDIGSCCL